LELVELLAAKDQGRPFDREQFESMVRESVVVAVNKQVQAGVTVINDGEQGKISFVGYRKDRLSGFELVDAREAGPPSPAVAMEARDYPEFYTRWLSGRALPTTPPRGQLCCVGPIGWKDFSEVQRDIDNFKAATKGVRAEELFMTAISPGTYLPPNRHYPSQEAYMYAMADAMAREYKAIVDAGFVLQIDAPDLTVMYRQRDMTFEEYRRAVQLCVEVINYSVRDIPSDKVRVHACWGADEAPHHRDVPLKDIVDLLVALRPAGLMVPGANGRHAHEWKVWQDLRLSAGKVIIPGVIDSTTNIIEHPEAVAERIVRYADVLGRENVIAGVDCGFDTIAAMNQVDPKIAWAKLRSLAEGAQLATKELWKK
jgi:5-methyltetrahydropteroyltriglutamate--homocysteine methyltransferase